MKRFALCLLTGALAAGWVTPGARGAAVNDPALDKQWGLAKIGAPQAWDRATGQGTVIAVVDTGVDLQHEDLKDKIVANVNCIGSDGDPARCSGSGQDDHGHGTHVAGIAAASINNGKGGAGTAPGAGIMAVKVLELDPLTGDASGALSDIEAGIEWAVDHGADVVNLSLGENIVIRELFGSGLTDAIEYAWERGVVAVVAAGNDTGLFGSGYRGVDAMVVTATTDADRQASYATDIGGAEWGIAAPGGESTGTETSEIYSTWWEVEEPNVYAWAIGTSMATPFVSGAVATLRSLGLTPEQAIDRILTTAVDLGPDGPDATFGYGRLDLAAATDGYGGSPAAEPPATTQPTGAPLTLPSPPVRVAGASATNPSGPGPTVPPPAEAPATTTSPGTTPDRATNLAAAPAGNDSGSPGLPPWLVVGAVVFVLVAVGGVRAVAARPGARL